MVFKKLMVLSAALVWCAPVPALCQRGGGTSGGMAGRSSAVSTPAPGTGAPITTQQTGTFSNPISIGRSLPPATSTTSPTGNQVGAAPGAPTVAGSSTAGMAPAATLSITPGATSSTTPGATSSTTPSAASSITLGGRPSNTTNRMGIPVPLNGLPIAIAPSATSSTTTSGASSKTPSGASTNTPSGVSTNASSSAVTTGIGTSPNGLPIGSPGSGKGSPENPY